MRGHDLSHPQYSQNDGATNRARFIAPDFLPKPIAPDSPPDTPTFNPDIHHRRSIRLRSYDYSQAGAYFITLCAQKRECLFGGVVGDVMRMNDVGRRVKNVWEALPTHYLCVELDAFVVMPNHIHGILVLGNVGAQFIAPNDDGAVNRGAMGTHPHPNLPPEGEGTIAPSPSRGGLGWGWVCAPTDSKDIKT